MNDNNSTILPSSQNANQVMWNTNTTSKVMENKTIVYTSEVMGNLMKMIDRVAPSGANILVLGESGTGKELIARSIHDRSSRKNKPFVAINCGALRETLLESELFGHEKGSFTGAYNRKIGLAEAANGGTLFLDEIGELDPAIQAKLLRFIQEGEMFRVGGKDPIKVDIRLICATNRELDQEVVRGNFREDLFYRINTIVVSAPPLRRRKEDIPSLVNHFLNNSQHAYLNRGRTVSDDAMKILMKYEWPGNIRELQNVCERLQILSDGHMIMLNDLPENIRNPETQKDVIEYDPNMTLHDLEKRYILKALQHFGGNKTQAANNLGITIKTLYNKLHEYGEFEKFAVHTKPAK
ncbi:MULTISPECIES: sigma-54-dependent Fis family transcriptional regulator [unclassified Bdellovibrio]|uniref:sigma-54 interaction domain-containing protein n=1 Tax=unclassified Bdellovibrio TaxID=2633795 RepID=UPI001157CB24|nr:MULTISPECIES: sigma-54 dependent transcriptional regulator [unclassified Bdellovibrio]QDK44338.1 sigma-54-dependent Fis family transcriptional regulator [Bdellovibrio sp. ZAP7]QLY26163.1 sigma-54-dependent Fis family transcriptional regulator [Bdellovibrio sp. KM01]